MKYASSKLLLIFAVLAVIGISSLAAQQSASAYVNANTSLTWKLIPATESKPGIFQISITPPKLPKTSSIPPSDLVVNVTIVVNGAAYFKSQCTFPGAGSLNLGSCNFQAPTDGPGEYIFIASFAGNHGGSMIAQSYVDPRIDPDW